MRTKSNKNEVKATPLMVDIKGLQELTGLGKNKALELGRDAGARVYLNARRTLYNVKAIQYYIDSRTGNEGRE